MQAIGRDLAVRWDNGQESYIPLHQLRGACPCASCKGETDIFGNLYKGTAKAAETGSETLVRITAVGGYGVQPVWGDGHSSGIFTHDYLLKLAGTCSTPPAGS